MRIVVIALSTMVALPGLFTACGESPTGPSKPLVAGTASISPMTGIVGTTYVYLPGRKRSRCRQPLDR